MFMRKITHKSKSLSRLISAIALAVALSSCGTTSNRPHSTLYDITAPAKESSQYYLKQAEKTQNESQADWYLLALKALTKEKKYSDATVLALRLAKMPLKPLQLSEWQLSRASLLQLTGKMQAAIDNLKFKPSWTLPNIQYERYFLQSAALYKELRNYPAMAMSLALATPYISDTDAKQKNWDTLWNLLERIPPDELSKLLTSKNKELSGWATLSKIMRDFSFNPVSQQEALKKWLNENPLHSANIYMPIGLSSLQTMKIHRPKTIGVLLPLTEKYADQGEAIRNGIIQGMLEDVSGKKPKILKFYDSNAAPMKKIIEDMKQDKIEFVLGPLQKNKVNEYLKLSNETFQTLAMNMPKQNTKNASNTCFFTLSPEQEAKQAAHFIAKKKHRHPLIIAPKNEFGQRVSQAFSSEWKKQTGIPAEISLFQNQASMQNAVKEAFDLSGSQSRIYKMNQLLNLKLKAEQRSRRDIDAVYLIASADELTLLKPFIEVAINPDADLPDLYTSSRGNNRVRGVGELGELRDITFTDVPLIVNPNDPLSIKHHRIWPKQSNDITRLYALGMDAYTLINALPEMKINPYYQLKAQSGILSLNKQCVIQRDLSWGKFGAQGFAPIK